MTQLKPYSRSQRHDVGNAVIIVEQYFETNTVLVTLPADDRGFSELFTPEQFQEFCKFFAQFVKPDEAINDAT